MVVHRSLVGAWSACLGLLFLSGCGSKVDLGDDGASDAGRTNQEDGGNVEGGTSRGGGVGGALDGGGAASAPTTLVPCPALPGKLAFDADDESLNRDIYLADGTDGETVRLTDDSSTDHQPSLSPDGTRLVFTSHRSGKPQLYLMDLATRETTRITGRPDGADQASFSRDGTRVTFHSGSSIFWMDLVDFTDHHVAAGLDQFNAYMWPEFTADGGGLVFDRNNEINMVELDGSGFRQIVQNTTAHMKAPSVSPSGSVVAYHVGCYHERYPSIWLTSFDKSSQLCEGRLLAENAEHAAWGPDDLLAFEHIDRRRNEGQIAVVASSGAAPCAFTPFDGRNARNPSWSE